MKLILSKFRILGQWQRCEEGFSLVELMIAASILATLSYFSVQWIQGQHKSQKGLEKRFESLNGASEIRSLLAKAANCKSTFTGINLKKYLFNQEPLPIKKFVKLRENQKGQLMVLAPWPITSGPPYPKKSFHLRSPLLKMRKYENYQNGDEINEVDTYLYLPFHWETQQSIQKIPLSFELDPNGLVTNCSSVSDRQEGKVLIIDPTKDTQLKGMSGYKACQQLGKTCVRVYSQNYATSVYGQIGLDNLCQTNYNQSLLGVADGVNQGQWHECEAKLGIYDTYKLDKKKIQLTCKGIFMAMCQ